MQIGFFAVGIGATTEPRTPDRRPVCDPGLCGGLHQHDTPRRRHLLVPEHNPLVLAKTAATVARM